MSNRDRLGGVIHTYQKYDPVAFPSPTAPPPDLVTPAFEHLLYFGSTRRLTEEELITDGPCYGRPERGGLRRLSRTRVQ